VSIAHSSSQSPVMSDMDVIMAAVRASMARDAQLAVAESKPKAAVASAPQRREAKADVVTKVAKEPKAAKALRREIESPHAQPWMEAKKAAESERLGKKRERDRKRKERSKRKAAANAENGGSAEVAHGSAIERPVAKRARVEVDVRAKAKDVSKPVGAFAKQANTGMVDREPILTGAKTAAVPALALAPMPVTSRAVVSDEPMSEPTEILRKAVTPSPDRPASMARIVPAAAVKQAATVGSNWNKLRKTLITAAPTATLAAGTVSKNGKRVRPRVAPAPRKEEMYKSADKQALDALEAAKAAKTKQPLQGSMFVRGALQSGPAVKATKVVALDCEFVGVGADGKEDALARASLVNSRGEVLYDSYVRIDRPVVDYRTFVSGVREEDVTGADADDPKAARATVAGILKGRILVGHAVRNDLRVMRITHPARDVRDTSDYYKKKWKRDGRRGGAPPALRLVVARILGVDQFQTTEHDSCEDARAALALYKKASKEWEAERRKR
jgi:RNA exonuclease 4